MKERTVFLKSLMNELDLFEVEHMVLYCLYSVPLSVKLGFHVALSLLFLTFSSAHFFFFIWLIYLLCFHGSKCSSKGGRMYIHFDGE